MTLRPLVAASLCLLACKPLDPDSDTGASSGMSSTGGDETLGNSSATDSDPTVPPDPTTTASTFTTEPPTTLPTTPTTDVTSDPTVPPESTSLTDDPSDPSGTSTTVDPTLPDTSSSTSPGETTDVFCGDVPNQPQDSECTDPSGCGCASGNCFVIPILGGWCGECLVDADCGDGGCTIPDPVHGVGAVCNGGKKGDGCMTDNVCVDPSASHCADIMEVPGIITVATCGECTDNSDCPAQKPNCTPVYDLEHFSGVTVCAADASIPNNTGCNPADDGMLADKACVSGHCGVANVMGLLDIGICGECDLDSDCMPGETCTDPQVDLQLSVLIGSVCQ